MKRVIRILKTARETSMKRFKSKELIERKVINHLKNNNYKPELFIFKYELII